MLTSTDSNSFETRNPGASEARWLKWAEKFPALEVISGPLLVVSPHPDDETLGAGGLIATASRAGAEVTILSLTDGEAACPEIPCLAEVRHVELSEAAAKLASPAPHIIRLNLGDGRLAQQHSRIKSAINDLLRDGMQVAAPFELDGHIDHEAAGCAALSVCSGRNVRLLRYPIWAWHLGSSALRNALNIARLSLPTDCWSAKLDAMNQFRSQLAERDGGAIVPQHVLTYFRRPFEIFLL